jgi:hypothetical protein
MAALIRHKSSADRDEIPPGTLYVLILKSLALRGRLHGFEIAEREDVMNFAVEWRRRLQMLLHRGQFRRDLEGEMRLHIELRRQQQIGSGIDPADAYYAAARRFGNRTRIQERSIMAWGWNGLETLLQDAAYGFRSMLRTPAINAWGRSHLPLALAPTWPSLALSTR